MYRFRESGFTYLGVLFLVAFIGAALAAMGIVWHTAQMREKERELLYVGNQIRTAIKLYYSNTPGSVKQYPRELSDLVLDPRYPDVRRYLRKIYYDPITGTKEWGIMKNPSGGITGVYSLSDAQPIKTANFGTTNPGFEDKKKYSEWQFVYLATPTTSPTSQSLTDQKRSP